MIHLKNHFHGLSNRKDTVVFKPKNERTPKLESEMFIYSLRRGYDIKRNSITPQL